MIEQAVEELTPIVGTRPACRALGVAPATIHRRRKPPPPKPRKPRPRPARALAPAEREQVLEELRSERFVDCSPAQVSATLLDEGLYLASERTMYRLLAATGESRERRDQRTHPAYAKPELLAERPNEVWSWDIERHEALQDRAEMKGSASGLSQQAGEAGGSPTGRNVLVGWKAAPTTTGRPSTARWVGPGKRDGKVYVRNQRQNAPQEQTTSSNLADLGWAAARTRTDGELPRSVDVADREATPKACGVGVAKSQGQSWAPPPSSGLERTWEPFW